MKKKILTAVLTLVMCFTILISVAGCKAGSTETLTVTGGDFANITVVDSSDYNAMSKKRIEILNSITEIKYDDGYLTDADPENDQYHFEKTWKTEADKNLTAYGSFLADGGLISGFTIDEVGTRIAVASYRGASFKIEYTVKAAA